SKKVPLKSLQRMMIVFLSLFFTYVFVDHTVGLFGAASLAKPEMMEKHLSISAKKLVAKAFNGLPVAQIMDYHTHVLGLNKVNGAYVNEKMKSWLHPISHIKFLFYRQAAGITDEHQADSQYINQLISLIKPIKNHGRYGLMAFDRFYNEDGSINENMTEFYVPNDYVVRLSKQYPEYFFPIISIHPYRKDAVKKLSYWAEQGVTLIKWLPNSMGIDPSKEIIRPFYQKMKQYGMVLITHTGEEQAVNAEGLQALGNPLLLRLPLEMGVKVVAAHSASLGKCQDLRLPNKPEISCFDLFLRMMHNERYKKYLLGEISATILFNRDPLILQTLLNDAAIHGRLINGSDYPLPVINFVIHTRKLKNNGFITESEQKLLNEIYQFNPLLFDFVLKRTLKSPVKKQSFSDDVFLNGNISSPRYLGSVNK
ncbi:MAG: hypothetical protein HON94_09645, partial [Methylococcales bacterium]|nr:hypothetical protein [Methylococcales bacterium]